MPMKYSTLEDLSPRETTLSIIRQYARNCNDITRGGNGRRIYLN